MKYGLLSFVLILGLLSLGGCKQTTLAVPNSPLATVTQYNDVLANSIGLASNTVIQLNQANMISVANAGPILTELDQVATADLSITQALSQATTLDPSTVSSITNYLNQIKTDAATMITNGSVGIKDPNSQKKYTQVLTGVISAADSLLVQLGG